jgi:hypothetical protein
LASLPPLVSFPAAGRTITGSFTEVRPRLLPSILRKAIMGNQQRWTRGSDAPDRRDRRRGRSRGSAVRDVVLPERAAKAAGAPSRSTSASSSRQKIDVGARQCAGSSSARPTCSRRFRSSAPADGLGQDQQPAYARNEHRSIKPGRGSPRICTHLGCSPTFRKDIAPADLGPDWLGGFFCPCHQSKFDLAGRVYKSMPAPTNLVVPPHKYLSDSKVLIGDDRA